MGFKTALSGGCQLHMVNVPVWRNYFCMNCISPFQSLNWTRQSRLVILSQTMLLSPSFNTWTRISILDSNNVTFWEKVVGAVSFRSMFTFLISLASDQNLKFLSELFTLNFLSLGRCFFYIDSFSSESYLTLQLAYHLLCTACSLNLVGQLVWNSEDFSWS